MAATMKSIDIEVAVANYLNYRSNLIVPNVHWGIPGMHECDLFVVTPLGYVWEIEIKVSKSDLLRDDKKRHGHRNGKIKDLYFAIPDYLQSEIGVIPERAGVLVVDQTTKRVSKLRAPKSNKTPYKMSEKERYKVARLGCMRIWGLKRKLSKKEATI